MKEFDYEKAKAGAPVCTRRGEHIRILCWDAKGDYPIVALKNEENSEYPMTYTKDGRFCKSEDGMDDLVMAPVKHEGWVNVYKGSCGYIYFGECYATLEKAQDAKSIRCVDTVKIEWEE